MASLGVVDEGNVPHVLRSGVGTRDSRVYLACHSLRRHVLCYESLRISKSLRISTNL